jgi:hypothetical protein
MSEHIKQPEKANTDTEGIFYVTTDEIIVNSGDMKSDSLN